MVDRVIGNLVELTAPADDDFFPIIDDSEVALADKNKKILWSTMVDLLGGVRYLGATEHTTNYTATATDVGYFQRMNSASATTFTIPSNASVPYQIGTRFDVGRQGTGTVALAVTTDSYIGNLNIGNQYDVVSAIKIDTTLWWIVGGTA